MSHILAAVDFSPVTQSIIAQAATLSAALHARLTILHVAAPNPDFVGYEVGPQTVRDARAHELHDEHSQLNEIANALTTQGIEANALLVAGATAETIQRPSPFSPYSDRFRFFLFNRLAHQWRLWLVRHEGSARPTAQTRGRAGRLRAQRGRRKPRPPAAEP